MGACLTSFSSPDKGYAVCFGVSGGILFLLIVGIIICCVGVCVYRRRRKRGVLNVHNERPERSETIEMATTPIDLATGQMNQQDTRKSGTLLPIEKNTDCDGMTKSYISKKSNYVYHKMDSKIKPQAQVPILPPPREKTVSVSREQTTSVSSDIKQSSLVSSANSNKLLVCSKPVPDSQTHSVETKKTTAYEDVKTVPGDSQRDIKDSTRSTHNDLITPLEMSVHLPNQQQTGSTEEASYKPNQSSPAKNVTNTSQQRKRDYEKVSADHSGKLASTDNHDDTHEEQYNVLSNQLDTVQEQSGVVQEDPAEIPAEDKYYSTTRVHRLVPVGKSISSQVSDHLYQVLDQPDQKKLCSSSKNNQHVQNRHNTFTASTTTPENQRSDDSLLRTYSSTAQTLEKLDPMYDEPYKPPRSSSLSKVNIYNVDSLFDDPKYDTKESTLAGSSRVFEDSTHTTKAAASDSRTVSSATNRHVSFSADTKLGVGESPIKKSASVVGKIYLSV